MYVHKDINCSQVLNKSLSINDVLECVIVELIIENKQNVIASCIYRKPGSNIDTFSENVEYICGNIPTNKIIFYVDTPMLTS